MAAGTGQSSGSAFESANPSQFALPLTCKNPDGTTYVSSDKNVFDFITPEDRNKVVTLTLIDVPAADFSLEAQQICFNAPYEFTTLAGTAAPADPVLGGFTGLLPDCLAEQVGPCHDRESDQAVSDPKDPDGLDVTLVADIPKGLPGDPHMR